MWNTLHRRLWNSLVVDSPRYLDALQASLFDSGATARIEALEGGPAAVAELAQRLGCEIAVNCAGLGGGALGGEDASAVTNGRGVVLQYERASVAGLAVVMSQEAPLSGGDATPAYVIPRGDVVVCGGSYDEGVTADASREEVGRIEASAAAIAPGSLGALRQVWVGHRPVRGAGVRVEVEPRATRAAAFCWRITMGTVGRDGQSRTAAPRILRMGSPPLFPRHSDFPLRTTHEQKRARDQPHLARSACARVQRASTAQGGPAIWTTQTRTPRNYSPGAEMKSARICCW